MKKRLRTLLSLVLSCALVVPAALAAGTGEGKLTLMYTAGENHSYSLEIGGLSGSISVYAVQVDLLLDGEHPDAKFIPASGDMDVPDREAVVSDGRTHLIIALDSQVPINDGKSLRLGAVSAGEAFTLPTTASLKLLDLKLNEISFAGAPTVSVKSAQSSGDNPGDNSGSGSGGISGSGGGSGGTQADNTQVKADAKGQAALSQSMLKKSETITVTSGEVSVELDRAAVAALTAANAAAAVSLTSVDRARQSGPQRAVTNGAPLYTVEITVDGGKAELGSGVLTLSVPFEGKGTPTAYTMAADGSFTEIALLRAEDGAVSLPVGAEAVSVVDMTHGFADVDGWYEPYVNTVAAQGIMAGGGEGRFSPMDTMTRAELVTTLARLSGDDLKSMEAVPFVDVPADEWYALSVSWAAQCGVSGGVGDGYFAPNGPVTREQFATMLARFAGQRGIELPRAADPVTFTDAGNISGFAGDAVALMQRSGIVGGKDGGRFDPSGTATRAECAKMLSVFWASWDEK